MGYAGIRVPSTTTSSLSMFELTDTWSIDTDTCRKRTAENFWKSLILRYYDNLFFLMTATTNYINTGF